MFFSVYSLGCKLNQLESEAVSDSFGRAGFELLPWNRAGKGGGGAAKASILIINTCTVTSMAEQKARRIIRKALREEPEACIIITGCYAQMEEAALAALEAEAPAARADGPPANEAPARRLFVLPGDKKDRLLDLPGFLGGVDKGVSGKSQSLLPPLSGHIAAFFSVLAEENEYIDGSFRFRPESFSSHSRAFIKIQDGCDNSCAYCRVSIARGKSRSLGAEEVLKELKSLEEKSFSEAVLTGVNICQYRDRDMALPELLDFLLRGSKMIRLRLSSIEPEALDDNFFRVLENPRIRPHFHLSLQSGSASVLERMGRPYSPSCVEKAIDRLRSVRENPFLACDIITGFPGESEKDFEETYEFCEKARFAWIHVFPFSPRPGTRAYSFPGRLPEREVSARAERLNSLAQRGRRDYIESSLGKEVEAVFEISGALSENYLKLFINPGAESAPAPGSLIRCRIHSLPGDKTPQLFDALGERLT